MEREERYLVIKLSDVAKALELTHITQSNVTALEHIMSKLWFSRAQRGKEDLKTVVVEHDWPEYEKVWQMIEDRVNAKDKEIPGYNEWLEGYESAKRQWSRSGEISLLKGINLFCTGWNRFAKEKQDEGK